MSSEHLWDQPLTERERNDVAAVNAAHEAGALGHACGAPGPGYLEQVYAYAPFHTPRQREAAARTAGQREAGQ